MMFKDGIGRKFLLITYSQTALFLLLWFGKIPTDDFRFLTLMVLGGYIGGNLGSKMIAKQEIKKD